MTPLERLREQVEAATPGKWARAYGPDDGDISTYDKAGLWLGEVEGCDHRLQVEDSALIISSTRLARALCDPRTKYRLAVEIAEAWMKDGAWEDCAVGAAMSVLNALAGMGLGDE